MIKIKEHTDEFERGRQEMIKEVLEYLSKRGFRESNYEIIELTKWLNSRRKNEK